AMNYLLELGHKRIGCIAGPEDMPLCHYRLQGYVQALRRSGITVDPHFIARGDFTYGVPGVQGGHGCLNEPRVCLEY
ncbi:hypothetical protein AN672_29230, partial [Citrobacter freundii]